jgi:sulfatase maturation enzyme AslB (radical SAM superfamily)
MTTALQTNLFVLSDAAIEVLARHHVGFGVSFDVVRGVRLSVNGQPSEDRVLANLERLHRAEIECGAITVLARHTCPMICDIFDFGLRGCRFVYCRCSPGREAVKSTV